MLTPQKALNFSIKTLLPGLMLSAFSHSNSKQIKKPIHTPFFVISEKRDLSLTPNFGYGISQFKSTNEILHEPPSENYLKKIQARVETIHCFSPKRQTQIDVPIRVFRTHYTVTFMPSEQFLAKRYSDSKNPQNYYNRQKDSVLSTYRLNCKHCGHEQTRSFPQNGFKFGTVITGCDHCNHIEMLSDHLGWIEDKEETMSKELIFNKKYVDNLIKKNLRKVGIDSDDEPQ